MLNLFLMQSPVYISTHWSETILPDFSIYYFYGANPDDKGKLAVSCLSSMGLFSGCHQILFSKPSVCMGVTKKPNKPQTLGYFWSQTALQVSICVYAEFADNLLLLAIG